MVYIFLVSWVIVCGIICFRYDKNYNVRFLVLSALCLVAIMGLRSLSVGVDTSTYSEYYYSVSNLSMKDIVSSFYTQSMEVGYCIFIKICSLIVKDYFFFQIVYAVIFTALIAKFLYDNSTNIFISLIVYLGIGAYLLSFNISRQMLAVAIVINGWTYLKKRKIVLALLLYALAISIHITAISFIIGYLIYVLRNKKVVMRVIPLIIVLLSLNYKWLLNIFYNNSTLFKSYFHKDYRQTAGWVWVLWLIIIAIALFILYFRKTHINEHMAIANYSLLWVACNVIGLEFSYFERVGLYYIMFVPILVALLLQYMSNSRLKRTYEFAVCLCFILYFLISALGPEQYKYTFFFS